MKSKLSQPGLFFRVLGKLLLIANIIMTIFLRYNYPLVSLNQFMIASNWVRAIHPKISTYQNIHLPDLEQSINYSKMLVQAYQYFDFLLIIMIVSGTKIGPILLMLQTLLIIFLQLLVIQNISDGLFYQIDDNCLNIVRQMGIIGTCFAMI